ncbi:hypothetical protein D1AOALGA4SA_10908 [Olavius algarvensis Delta 1 endosymbiont]|nr:hypothetical protein D1AOALGA4SA_10908 [Olavius algarvensis Delta 1 endosymbiont]
MVFRKSVVVLARHLCRALCEEIIVKNIEDYIGGKLPSSYKQFLESHNERPQNDVVVLYLIDELIERNKTYETTKYAPGYINIGDDSGGSAFLLKLGENDPPVHVVGHGSMDPKYMELVSDSFIEWLKSGCKYDQ